MFHPIDALHARLSEVEPYPAGVVPIPGRLDRLAFFPGGWGVWGADEHERPRPPVGGLMVLGHNFDSEAGFQRSLKNRGESAASPTWSGLAKLMGRAFGSDAWQGQTFFTNFFMGLIEGDRAVGAFPGAKDPAFVARCAAFLAVQVELMEPKVIAVLGAHTPHLLGASFPGLVAWRRAQRLADLDDRGVAVLERVELGGRTVSVVALTHPSLRGANVGRRRYRGKVGDAAELEMLRAALRAGGLLGGELGPSA